jgi:enoyl-CoA hydratase/carnithine racemase
LTRARMQRRLARAVGPARAIEMPRDALEAGLVHRVVTPGRLAEEGRYIAERLARRAPRAVWAIKRSVYRGFSSSWAKSLQLDRSGFAYAAAYKAQQAMRFMLEQIESLPAHEATSPWTQADRLREWQEGTTFSFNEETQPRPHGGSVDV